jgi:hypothetical protein
LKALGDNQMTKTFWVSALLVSSAFAVSGCGQAVSATAGSPTDDSQSPNNQNEIASFGNQCPYGYVEEPTAAPIDMSDCPNAQIVLAQPLEPIIISADCPGKNLTARTSDRTVDNTFETMPDGSFYLEMPAGTAVLSNGCQIPLVADMAGDMNCGSLTASNYDQVDISIDAVWKAAPAPSPTPGVPAAPAPAAGCALPAGCMLHASTVVHQCKQ